MRRQFRVTVDGRTYEVLVEEVATGTDASLGEAASPVGSVLSSRPPVSAPHPVSSASGVLVIKAPLPGMVLDVKAEVGASVEAGQVLVILEAMKMENEIVAPRKGVVREIHVTKGSGVSADDPLLVLA